MPINPFRSVGSQATRSTCSSTETTAPDGQADGLQLAHSTPRGWLEPGKRIAVTDGPTDFGPVSYTLDAVGADRVDATVDVPPRLGAGDEF